MQNLSRIKKIQDIINPQIKRKYIKYHNLPPKVQEKLFNIETADIIRRIAEENNLNSAQLWSISHIIGMVLLGETNIIDFLKLIGKECELETESARKLARDINSAIFLPIKDDLKKIHNISEWPRENENKISNIPQINGNIVNLKK